MKCMERKRLEEIEKTCVGRMKRSRIPYQERRQHLKSCVGFHQKKIRHKYKPIRNQTRKTVARAIRMETNQELKNLY